MTDKKEMTFGEWSKIWDRLFNICVRNNDFRALVVHTITNFNKEWTWKV